MKTVNKELSIKLKENGYPQESTYRWWDMGRDYGKPFHDFTLIHESKGRHPIGEDEFSSPTADEILNSLPIYFDCNSDNHRYHMRIHPNFNGEKNGKEIKDWIIGYKLMEVYGGKWHEKNPFGDENLANAAARLWLYLKENDLLSVKR